jgi:hypothetical protein
MGEWQGNARRGRIHGGVRLRKIYEGEEVDRWGPRASKGAYMNGRSELTERNHRAERERERERESGRAHEETGADKLAPPCSRRERRRERGRGSSLTGGTHLLGEAGTTWLGWTRLNGSKYIFSFSKKFLNAFLFILSMDFKSNSNSNMCIKQKNNLAQHDATFHDSHWF